MGLPCRLTQGQGRIGRAVLLPDFPRSIASLRGQGRGKCSQVYRPGVTELIGVLSVHLARIDAELMADMRELDRVGQALVRHHHP